MAWSSTDVLFGSVSCLRYCATALPFSHSIMYIHNPSPSSLLPLALPPSSPFPTAHTQNCSTGNAPPPPRNPSRSAKPPCTAAAPLPPPRARPTRRAASAGRRLARRARRRMPGRQARRPRRAGRRARRRGAAAPGTGRGALLVWRAGWGRRRCRGSLPMSPVHRRRRHRLEGMGTSPVRRMMIIRAGGGEEHRYDQLVSVSACIPMTTYGMH